MLQVVNYTNYYTLVFFNAKSLILKGFRTPWFPVIGGSVAIYFFSYYFVFIHQSNILRFGMKAPPNWKYGVGMKSW